MIYDCFIFNDELDVLEIRLNELDSVVDEFVLIEMEQTFSGKPKPLYFSQNRDRFRKWLPRIKVSPLALVPEIMTAPQREEFQRMILRRTIPNVERPDVVIWTDVDEIPKKDCVEKFQHCYGHQSQVASLQMYHHVGFLNWRRHDFYYHPKILGGDAFWSKTPHELRWDEADWVMPEAGWHFSYLGGMDAITKKVNDGAHRWQNDTVDSTLARYREYGIVKSENFAMQVPLVKPHMPDYVIQNASHFKEIGFLL